MPHTPEEKKKATSRLRRIRGQVDALERAIGAGTDCGDLLQQLAALRGAVNGLFTGILEGHMRETFGPNVNAAPARKKEAQAELDNVLSLLRSYLK